MVISECSHVAKTHLSWSDLMCTFDSFVEQGKPITLTPLLWQIYNISYNRETFIWVVNDIVVPFPAPFLRAQHHSISSISITDTSADLHAGNWDMSLTVLSYRTHPFLFPSILAAELILFSFLRDGFEEHPYISAWPSLPCCSEQCDVGVVNLSLGIIYPQVPH